MGKLGCACSKVLISVLVAVVHIHNCSVCLRPAFHILKVGEAVGEGVHLISSSLPHVNKSSSSSLHYYIPRCAMPPGIRVPTVLC